MILISWANRNIAVHIPWEILESICDQYEEIDLENEETSKEVSDTYFASHPVPEPEYEAALAEFDIQSECHVWPTIPAAKHEKNLFVFLMTHVCRSWRLRLVGLKRLWRDIAFSADMRRTGVQLSNLFLTRVGVDTPLHIYAGLPFGDVLDPAIGALLGRLRQETHRWERFFYSGRLGPYRSYLDLPAPSLRHFSDSKDLCHIYSNQTNQLFAGHTPLLQFLVTSALKDWQPTTLTGLRTLDLWDCAPKLSIELLLSVLRCTQQLEEINIVSPNPPLLDCPPDEVVNLPRLKNLKVQNPDFYTIIGHFDIPNVETVHLYSSSHREANGLGVGRAFQISDPFVGLASMVKALPMFGQPIVFCSLDLDPTSSGLRFIVSITTGSGALLRVDLEWTGGFGVHARSGYIQNSMSALAQMPFVPSSLLFLRARPQLIGYNNPLFRIDAIACLLVEGERFMTIINVLRSRPGQPQLLPKLQYLIFPEDELDEKKVGEIPKFLRFRKRLVIVLNPSNRNLVRRLARVCVIQGKFVPLGRALTSASLTPLSQNVHN